MSQAAAKIRIAFVAALFLGGLAASSAAAQLPSGTWQYLWGDEFTGNSLDTKKWSYNYPWGATHNHDAYMDPDNVVLGDGTLTLVAQRVAQGGKPFTSGAVSTGYTKFNVNGGYIEARIRLPDTPGSWPAFWGLYTGWPPEADIMEYPIDTAAGSGYSPDEYHTAFHYRNSSGGNSAGAGKVNPSSAGDLGGAYHNFGMEWREDDWVGFYFDGQLVSQFGDDTAIAQMQQMYLILNYAVGGWPGTPSLSEWPAGHTDETKVDWVRVWKQADTRTTNWAYTGTSGDVQWDTAGNWNNGAPNLGGVAANFNTVGVAEQRLDWSGIRTLTTINLNGGTRYRIGWSDDRLVLAGANNAAGNAAINVASTSTIDHEVRAELELFSTLAIANASNQPLTLSGAILGVGGITVDGPGAVVFSNNNTYTGNTIIDSGSQGPAVALVTRSRPFGTGNVTIGAGGNSTTGRIGIQDNREVPNTIYLSGRNNASVALENLSGNNVFSGTIHATAGGSNYIIQSDAGLLSLTGAASGAAGIALTAAASGSRTFTLQGAGNGSVSGAIQNGAGIVGITKAGSGTWTLSGPNTYAGVTSVIAGRLIVTGSLTGNATVDAAGVFELATTGGSAMRDTATVANNGQLHITATGQTLASISGTGETTVAGALAVSSIRQDKLTIDAGGWLTISKAPGEAGANVVNFLQISDGTDSTWAAGGAPVSFGAVSVSGGETTVPEPATWLLAVIAALAGLMVWRRRR